MRSFSSVVLPEDAIAWPWGMKLWGLELGKAKVSRPLQIRKAVAALLLGIGGGKWFFAPTHLELGDARVPPFLASCAQGEKRLTTSHPLWFRGPVLNCPTFRFYTILFIPPHSTFHKIQLSPFSIWRDLLFLHSSLWSNRSWQGMRLKQPPACLRWTEAGQEWKGEVWGSQNPVTWEKRNSTRSNPSPCSRRYISPHPAQMLSAFQKLQKAWMSERRSKQTCRASLSMWLHRTSRPGDKLEWPYLLLSWWLLGPPLLYLPLICQHLLCPPLQLSLYTSSSFSSGLSTDAVLWAIPWSVLPYGALFWRDQTVPCYLLKFLFLSLLHDPVFFFSDSLDLFFIFTSSYRAITHPMFIPPCSFDQLLL